MIERRGERGAASVEYALVTAVVVIALFIAPVTPAGDSAVEFVMKALRQFQHHATYLLSLP